MNELNIEAKIDNLDEVLAFIDEHLEECECPMKVSVQVDVAVEEIFVNIASYAYAPGTGMATIIFSRESEPDRIELTFIDEGVEYDPLKKEDPDVTLSAEEREIGGLGIFMVKKSMDDMKYERRENKNVLTLVKLL